MQSRISVLSCNTWEGTVHSHKPSLDDAASLESLQFRFFFVSRICSFFDAFAELEIIWISVTSSSQTGDCPLQFLLALTSFHLCLKNPFPLQQSLTFILQRLTKVNFWDSETFSFDISVACLENCTVAGNIVNFIPNKGRCLLFLLCTFS
jgi:hypothetical protein